MIGGILGGTTAMRLGEALRHAEMESIKGQRVLVVSAVAKSFPVVGRMPEVLAPGYTGNRPVDVVAECYAAMQGVSAATKLFTDAAFSGEGGGVNRDSSDIYWFESMRSGMAALFQIAGILAVQDGHVRSLNRILCDCFDDLNDCVCNSSMNSTPSRPEWFKFLPEYVQRPLLLKYLGKTSPGTFSHLSTLAVAVEELRRGAPERWTKPFVVNSVSAPLFLYSTAWGNVSFHALLQICLRRGFFLLLPELHLWPESDLRRIGHVLKFAGCSTNIVWTSLSVPPHPGFETAWEIYGASGSSDVQVLFQARLNASGMETETRLKDMEFETPASLDAEHALLRSQSGWRTIPCAFFDERRMADLEGGCTALSGETFFDENMAEIAVAMPKNAAAKIFKEDTGKRAEMGVELRRGNTDEPEGEKKIGKDKPKLCTFSSKPGRTSVRVVEGMPDKAVGGKFGYYSMNGEKLLFKNVMVDKKNFVALLGGEVGEPQAPLALYEKLWTADIPPEREISYPRVDAFIPVNLNPGKELASIDGSVEMFSPRFGSNIRLVLHGLKCMSSEASVMAFGTWLEPRKVFLVRSLLKPLKPFSPSSKDFSRRTPPLQGVWEAVHESGKKLRAMMEIALERMDGEAGTIGLHTDLREELAHLRSNYQEKASVAMDLLHNGGKPVKRLGNRGIFQMDLRDLCTSKDPKEVLCAVDSSGLPPADYRERLRKRKLGVEFISAFDGVFASLLLNLDANLIERTNLP